MRPRVRAAPPALVLVAVAVLAGLTLVLWSAVAARPQPVLTARGPAALSLPAPGVAARILDLWLWWDAPAGQSGWAVLEHEASAEPAAELVRRRQVHRGWNHLVWSDLEEIGGGTGLALRMSSGEASWALGTPHFAAQWELRHLHALRGPLLALALAAILAAVALARSTPRLAAIRRGVWPGPWALLVGAAMVVGLALRLRTLSSQSLWFDEVLTAIGSQSLAWVLYTPQVFGHPPLHYLVGWAAGTHDDGMLRLPFALAGAATVGAVALLGRRLAGTAAGAVAAWLLAVSTFHIELSQLARPWVGLVLLSVLSTHALVRALDEGRARSWCWFAVLTALAVYTQYLALPMLAIQALAGGIGLAMRRGRGWPVALAGLGLVAVLLWPLVDIVPQLTSRHVGSGSVAPDAVLRLVADVLVPHFLGGGAATAAGLVCLALGAFSLRHRPEVLVIAVCWLLGPLVLIWAAQPHHFVAGRHLAVLLPVVLVLVGRGADLAGRWIVRLAGLAVPAGGPRRVWPARAVSAVLALALSAGHAPSLGAYYEARRGPDWRTVAAVLDRVVEPGDQVVASLGAAYPLRHYWRADAVIEMDLATPPTAGRQRVWLVTLAHWDDDSGTAAWLEAHAVRVGEVPGSWSQPGVRIHRLRPTAAGQPPR